MMKLKTHISKAPLLEARHLNAGYGNKPVVHDVTLKTWEKEIMLIAGGNGSGKSTLFKAIYGLLPNSTTGEVIFNGDDITRLDTRYLIQKGISYVPQKNSVFENLTVAENLDIAGFVMKREIYKSRLENVLNDFSSLKGLLKRKPLSLSGGERQLLSLSMAVINQPKIIMLDEPFNGLTPKAMELVINHLINENQSNGTTIILIEHRIKECLKIAHRVVGLKLGMVYKEWLVDKNFESSNLNELFI